MESNSWSEERKIIIPVDFNNKRLNTPGLQRYHKNSKDCYDVLKEQINQSNLRIKAVKFGNSVWHVAPEHSYEYYVPFKDRYVDPISKIKW